MLLKQIQDSIAQSLNEMFLNFNRWQGYWVREFIMIPIDTEVYNFEHHARHTEYYMCQELEERLLERIGIINSIISHCEQGSHDDLHMLAVWVPALRDTERKLADLQNSKKERFPKYSDEMTYLTKTIDRYETCLKKINEDSPMYDTIKLEVKRLRRRWQELARTHNPRDL